MLFNILGGIWGKLGFSNGSDTGFGLTKLVAGVVVDSGVCVMVVTCVVATPSLAPVLAASKKGTAGVAVLTVSLMASSVPIHSDQGGGYVSFQSECMSVRLTRPAVPVVHPLESSPNGLAQCRLKWLGSSDQCERGEGESREHSQSS